LLQTLYDTVHLVLGMLPTALATRACRQSPYLRPVPAATNPAILIMTSLSTEATPSVTDVRTPYRV